MRDHLLLYGQLFFDSSLENLDNLFRGCELHHEIRHSSFFRDEKYLRIWSSPDTELTFEIADPNEFLIRGEANTQEDLLKLADIVSSFFKTQKLRHRLELYDANGNEFQYYHYDWSK